MLKSLASVLLLAASAAAHATWQQIWVNGVDGGNSCARAVSSNSPLNVNSGNLACNAAQNSNQVCTIQPGDKVTVEMHQQPGQRQCGSEAIGGQHYGPVMVYMASVSNAKTADAASASWFKVHELGLVSNNPMYWAVQVLNDNCGKWTFTVPDVAPGDYLLRAEVIALHTAGQSGGAQLYPGCFQVTVVGNGSARPSGVRFPGAYSANDPGVLVDIHRQLSNYTIPGPRPYGFVAPPTANTKYPTAATWTGGAPNTVPTVTPPPPAGLPPPVTTVQPPVVTSQPPVVTSQPPVATPPPQTNCANKYGQCGGQGWSGSTCCASGSTCNKLNDYYSQCV